MKIKKQTVLFFIGTIFPIYAFISYKLSDLCIFAEPKWCSLAIKVNSFLTGGDSIFYGVLYWILILYYLSTVDSHNKKYYRLVYGILLMLLAIFFIVHIIAGE